MTEKKSFIVHIDSLEVLDYLDKDQIADLFLAIRDYQTKGMEAVPYSIRAIFVPFKNQFDRDLESYEKKCEANRNNGLKGGRPKRQTNPKNPVGFSKSDDIPIDPKKADNEKDNDNNKDNNNNNKDNVKDIILLEKESKETLFEKSSDEFSDQLLSDQKEKKIAPKKEKVAAPEFSEFWQYTQNYISEKKLGPPENWKISIEAKYNAWIENNWKDGNGRQIQNWKTKIQNTIPFLKPYNGKPINKTSNYGSGQSSNGNGKVSGTAEIISGARYTEFT